MAINETHRYFNEFDSGRYQAQLLNEEKEQIPLSDITTLSLTLFTDKTKTVINSRNRQNVLNQNNVSINATGLLTWDIQPEDSQIIDSTIPVGQQETHHALFELTYGVNRRKQHLVTMYVVQLPFLPPE